MYNRAYRPRLQSYENDPEQSPNGPAAGSAVIRPIVCYLSFEPVITIIIQTTTVAASYLSCSERTTQRPVHLTIIGLYHCILYCTNRTLVRQVITRQSVQYNADTSVWPVSIVIHCKLLADSYICCIGLSRYIAITTSFCPL